MAQQPSIIGIEPWLKTTFFEGLSHGLNSEKMGSWAMAQRVFLAMAQTPKK